MKLLLKDVTILDKSGPYHNQTLDVLVEKGKIVKITKNIKHEEGIKVVSSNNLHVSTGWVDIGTQLGEPGLEHRETFASAIAAARVGGYTTLIPFPNTLPVLQNKAALTVLHSISKNSKINILPIAALTTDCKGEELVEMYDLHQSGAVAFSDGLKSIHHNGVLLNALNYVKTFDGLIIHYPIDQYLSNGGQIHEGKVSTLLGMKGIPSIAEHISIQRDLELLNYSGSKLCLYGISTQESVKLIKLFGKKNLFSVVPYLNLVKQDTDLADFDTNLKLYPPLRTKIDQNELLKALKSDIITAISSNHYPLEEDAKKLEFPYAKYGASGLETVFPALNTFAIDKLPLETIIDKLTNGPKSIFNLSINTINEGIEADLTFFDPSLEWEYQETKSASKNNPYLGQTLKGKVLGTLVKGEVFMN